MIFFPEVFFTRVLAIKNCRLEVRPEPRTASYRQLIAPSVLTTHRIHWLSTCSSWESIVPPTIKTILTGYELSALKPSLSNLLFRTATLASWCCATFMQPSSSDISTGAWWSSTSSTTPNTLKQLVALLLQLGCRTKWGHVSSNVKFLSKLLTRTSWAARTEWVRSD